MSGAVSRTTSFVAFSFASTLMGASLVPLSVQSAFAQSDMTPGLVAPLVGAPLKDGSDLSPPPSAQSGGPVRLLPRRLTPKRSPKEGALDAGLDLGVEAGVRPEADVVEMGESTLATPTVILGPPVGADRFKLLAAPPGGDGSGIQVGVLGRVDEASVGIGRAHV